MSEQQDQFLQSVEAQVLGSKIDGYGEDIKEIKGTLKEVAQSLSSLAVLETKHSQMDAAQDRAFKQIAQQGDRLQAIETVMPGLKEVRKWVIGGVLAVVSMVGMSYIAQSQSRVVYLPAPQQQGPTINVK